MTMTMTMTNDTDTIHHTIMTDSDWKHNALVHYNVSRSCTAPLLLLVLLVASLIDGTIDW
jgi:hypothetical protein